MPLEPAPNGYPIKLVRDLTPAIVNPSSEPGDLWYERLPEGEDRRPWLVKKLGEELFEYLADGGRGELAQVLSVIEALADLEGTDLTELIAIMRADPRGGFRDAVMMYGRHPEYDR